MGAPSSTGQAFIGVGSNIGDRLEHINRAAELLCRTDGVRTLISAPIYKTRPVGPAGPGNFYNTVFRLTVALSPCQLWRRLQEIEVALGRPPVRTPGHVGARTIDLDLLLYDDLIIQNEDLTVPHPRLCQRAFVLVPLCDLAPDFCCPESGLSIRELLAQLPPSIELIGRVADPVTVDISVR
ncbi:MAG: 2-amino-4-hydroxy-6-hydroxymethyldihydropteridine diphosphokinase [Candidatus Zixiibacteriota bacterium]